MFLTKSSVMLFLFRQNGMEKEILLQKRYNTGYSDGMWDCAAAGRVEKNESMKIAMVREAKEELGITIDIKNVSFATLTHKYSSSDNETFYNGFFTADVFEGTPSIMEPEKCSDLERFNIKSLPDNFMPDRKHALENYFSGISYDEVGWEVFMRTN